MLIEKPYRNDRAVVYARKWALGRNPLFIDFTGSGGNCTNFVSQCVLAGSCVMNRTEDFGWYYVTPSDRAPAWSGVTYFYQFLTAERIFAERNGGIGPFAMEVDRSQAVPGDVIQFQNEDGEWYHTVMISEVTEDDILVCAHTNDSKDRPLSTYTFANARFLHIMGVRVSMDDQLCYDYLLSGGQSTEPEEVPEEPVPDLPPPDTDRGD